MCPGLWRHDITVLRVAMAINTKIINNGLLIPFCFWFAVNVDLREGIIISVPHGFVERNLPHYS